MAIGAVGLIAGMTAGVILDWSLLLGGGMFATGLVLLYFYLKRLS
jgi:hypothetical protein